MPQTRGSTSRLARAVIHSRGWSRLLLGAICLMFAACASRDWNLPLPDQSRVTAAPDRYGFRTRLPHNDRHIFVVLAFSGGGTRAAAFSYGVLEKLRKTWIQIDGRPHRLLDEVDVITSVSGGSYTAANYGLFGKRIFSDFVHRFLYRNWQDELLGLLANPFHLLDIAMSGYKRSDLVAHYLDETLFTDFSDRSRLFQADRSRRFG